MPHYIWVIFIYAGAMPTISQRLAPYSTINSLIGFVTCVGGEQSLKECSSYPGDCENGDFAGVICEGILLITITSLWSNINREIINILTFN